MTALILWDETAAFEKRRGAGDENLARNAVIISFL